MAKFSQRIKFRGKTLDADTPPHPSGKQFDYWGIDEGGLGLRVGPAGKSWVLNMRRPGAKSSSRITIGKYPALGLQDARDKAEDRRSELRADKPAKGASSHGVASLTWGAAALEYANRKKLRPVTVAVYKDIIGRKPVADWGKKSVTQITKGFVHAELTKVTAPVMANRMRAFIVGVLRYVEMTRDGYVAPRFSRQTQHEEVPRTRTLNDAELAKLWTGLDAQDQRLAVLYKMLILLGTRVWETLRMQWSDLDLQAGTWSVPTAHTKSKRGFTVYLPKQAVALLQGMPRWKKTDSVFSADGSNEPHRRLHNQTQRISQAVGVKGWVPHDLRRTFRSGLDRLGIEPHVAELCMNHVRPVLERTYSPNVDVYAPKLRAAWQSYSDHVYALIVKKAEA